ncbi:hypothetical protein BJX70DRAFT_362524 [Aspergillus crustosus]
MQLKTHTCSSLVTCPGLGIFVLAFSLLHPRPTCTFNDCVVAFSFSAGGSNRTRSGVATAWHCSASQLGAHHLTISGTESGKLEIGS